MTWRHAAVLLVLAACPGMEEGEPDGARDGSEDAGDAPCVAPTAEPAWLPAFLTGHVQQLAAEPRASVAQRNTARSYLMTQLSGLGLTTELHTYDSGANVIGTLPATTATDRWIVLGAHFDSVTDSPGANDNATGVAVVLAAARGVSALPCRGAHVAFVLFDQEEVGLIGSGVYAAAQRAAGRNIVAAHTIDQTGWDDDDDLGFEIERPSSGFLARYQEAAAAVGARVVATDTGSTDHESFRAQGFAAAGVTEEYVSGDTTPHYHLASDTAATVDTVYHRIAARMVTYVLSRELGAPAP